VHAIAVTIPKTFLHNIKRKNTNPKEKKHKSKRQAAQIQKTCADKYIIRQQ
jgi:hypothetical protein